MEIPLSFSMHPHSEKDISCNMEKKIRQKEFLVRSMTHGDPTEFTHALSLEKENENERLPKRLHHLRFLSTTRINHAGLLFGKHGILLSHT